MSSTALHPHDLVIFPKGTIVGKKWSGVANAPDPRAIEHRRAPTVIDPKPTLSAAERATQAETRRWKGKLADFARHDVASKYVRVTAGKVHKRGGENYRRGCVVKA